MNLSLDPPKVLNRLILRAFNSRRLASALFPIRFGPIPANEGYFDTTTIALFRHAAKYLGPSSSVVDMGTGPSAAIGLSLRKRVGCHVTCVDIDAGVVASARENIRLNRAPIDVVESRFFQSVTADFDTVVFNPPYVSPRTAERRGLRSRQVQWDGGVEGTDVIAGYLEAVAALRQPVVSLLAVNASHVPRPVMERVLARGPANCALKDVSRHRLLPVDVYTIVKAAGSIDGSPESERTSK